MSAPGLTIEEAMKRLIDVAKERDAIIEQCAAIADDGGGCGEYSEFASGMDAAASGIADRIRRLKTAERFP